MGKITGIAVLAVVTLAAAASALDVGVGAFYAPARVVAGAAEIKEFNNPRGFKGHVSVGVYEGLNVAFGVGYNDFLLRECGYRLEDQGPLESIRMIILTLGADYGFRLGPFLPYAGGGAALARESAEAFAHTTTDWYGGLYVEGGARYFLINSLAVEAAPRYTLLFDEPVVDYDGWDVHDFVRSEHRSQLIEFLVGINYYF
jgi:opacity protein-like surface antigen